MIDFPSTQPVSSLMPSSTSSSLASGGPIQPDGGTLGLGADWDNLMAYDDNGRDQLDLMREDIELIFFNEFFPSVEEAAKFQLEHSQSLTPALLEDAQSELLLQNSENESSKDESPRPRPTKVAASTTTVKALVVRTSKKSKADHRREINRRKHVFALSLFIRYAY